MRQVNFISRFGVKNIGDSVSSPIHYFDFFGDNHTFEYNHNILPYPMTVIGGGLFGEHIINRAAYGTVWWGVGVANMKEANLKPKGLFSTRDWGFEYRWVPCASCMSHLFDKERKVTRDVVIYEHQKTHINMPDIPKMRNNTMDFEKVLDFLGSANYVITSSYHGAYWSLLLGKRVYLVKELNAKTRYFKWQPVYCKPEDCYRLRPERYEGVLEECREANIKFYSDTCDFLEKYNII